MSLITNTNEYFVTIDSEFRDNEKYPLETDFAVKFQTTSSSAANLVGGDIVKLEYLSSNGSNANGTSIFTSILTPVYLSFV